MNQHWAAADYVVLFKLQETNIPVLNIYVLFAWYYLVLHNTVNPLWARTNQINVYPLGTLTQISARRYLLASEFKSNALWSIEFKIK